MHDRCNLYHADHHILCLKKQLPIVTSEAVFVIKYCNQTIPWLTIASATLRKPAMFAPAT
jgi:hypothetical protein